MNRRLFLTAAAAAVGTLKAAAPSRQAFIAGVIPAGRTSTSAAAAPNTDPIATFWKNCDDASGLGFRHIEFNTTRTRIAESYADRAAEFKDETARRGLKLAGLALFSHTANRAERSEVIERHMLLGRFLAALGGTYITHMLAAGTALNESRNAEDYRNVELDVWVANANEIGKRLMNEYGVKLAYHPEQVEVRTGLWKRVLEASDGRYLGFLPDTGHLASGGVDPAAVCREHHSRLVCVHLKDFRPEGEKPAMVGKLPFGQGSVNLPAVVDTLRDLNFAGHVMGESGVTNRLMHDYMTDTLKLTL
jgi:inosose dehydratase